VPKPASSVAEVGRAGEGTSVTNPNLREFWRNFVAADWKGRAVKLPPGPARLEVTPEHLLRAFAAARVSRPDALFFNRELAPGSYSRHAEAPPRPQELPNDEDVSLPAYATRVTAYLGGGRFCLRLVDAQEHEPRIGDQVDAFLAGLMAELPRRPRVTVVAFVGDYDFTPVGVHTDAEPIFHAVVMGKKRGRFWTPARWERERRDARMPGRYLDDALSYELSAGDVVYWPAGMYHVFECVGLAAALSIGLWLDG
jgi:cupin superfamily protein